MRKGVPTIQHTVLILISVQTKFPLLYLAGKFRKDMKTTANSQVDTSCPEVSQESPRLSALRGWVWNLDQKVLFPGQGSQPGVAICRLLHVTVPLCCTRRKLCNTWRALLNTRDKVYFLSLFNLNVKIGYMSWIRTATMLLSKEMTGRGSFILKSNDTFRQKPLLLVLLARVYWYSFYLYTGWIWWSATCNMMGGRYGQSQ